MTLILTIEGADTLDNGQPGRLDLDRHGAMIGRSPHADWSLPDPRSLISSRHCEISYRDGQYLLSDHSTNGTFLNGAAEGLQTVHPLADGDRFTVGHYTILASGARAAVAAPVAATQDSWGSLSVAGQGNRESGDAGWAEPPEPVVESGASWRPAEPQPSPPRPAGAWDLPAPVARPSAWSSEPRRAVLPTAEDVWGRLSNESEIDWSRGNFVAIAPSTEDWGAIDRPAATSGSARNERRADGETDAVPGPADSPDATDRPAEQHANASQAWTVFVEASGLPTDRLNRAPVEALAAAGAILRQMVGGLMLMIEARARAKAQLGVQATGLELDGNNVLKFVRSPERALVQLLDEPQRGFMPAERAVEDAFQDLQAHQMATLTAMRGALDGTLSRFAPAAIRDRLGEPSRWARWFPVLHRARQWDAYERDFEGAVRGANDAFMDLFGKEFRLHYDRHIGEMKARRRASG